MKTNISIIISLILGLMLFASTAMAQSVCPEGTTPIVRAGTNEGFCAEIDQLEFLSDYEVKSAPKGDTELTANEIMRSSGGVLEIGLGYSPAIAALIHLNGGYHFNVESLNGMSFGLYGEIDGTLGWPFSLDVSVVPMMHIYGESFRISFGFGLGYYRSFDNHADLFEMKPELRLDWFSSKHWVFGMRLCVPLTLQKTLLASSNDIHFSEKETTHYLFPRATFDFILGYKF